MKISKHLSGKIIPLILTTIILTGCADELFTQTDKTFNGQDRTVFKPATNTVNERANASNNPNVISPQLQLISSEGTLGSDISIEYSVDDSSTAVSDTDYNIVSQSPLEIESGTVSTNLEIEVTADGLNNGETRTLYISQKNVNGSDVLPAVNYKTYTLIIRGVTD